MERIEFKVGQSGNIVILFKETYIGSLLRHRTGIYNFFPAYEIRNQVILLQDWEEIGRKWRELENKK